MTGTRKILCTVAAAALAAGVAGCSTPPKEDWKGVRAPFQPTVDIVSSAHAVPFAPGAVDPAAGESAGLEAFLADSRATRDDRILLVAGEAPAGIAQQRVLRLGGRLRDLGARVFTATPDAAGPEPVPADSVVVVLRQAVVTLPPCPDWTVDPAYDFDNRVGPNWGCANAYNLGLMIAHPEDLLSGQKPGPAEAVRSAMSIERYRKDEVKKLQPEDVSATQNQQKKGTGEESGAKEGN